MTLPSPPAGRVQELPFIVEPLRRLDALPLVLEEGPKLSGMVLVEPSLEDGSFVNRDELTFGVNVVMLFGVKDKELCNQWRKEKTKI